MIAWKSNWINFNLLDGQTGKFNYVEQFPHWITCIGNYISLVILELPPMIPKYAILNVIVGIWKEVLWWDLVCRLLTWRSFRGIQLETSLQTRKSKPSCLVGRKTQGNIWMKRIQEKTWFAHVEIDETFLEMEGLLGIPGN